MKVKAVQTRFTNEQRVALGVGADVDPNWQLTLDGVYTVYAITCLTDPGIYGKAALYMIVDDFGRLLPVPSCFFEIVDPNVSRYWMVGCSATFFKLAPREFFENQFFTEELLDGEEDALAIFATIRSDFDREVRSSSLPEGP